MPIEALAATAAWTAFCAALFARMEVDEIRHRQLVGNRSKLPHALLNVYRAVVIVPAVGLIIAQGYDWPARLLLLAFAGAGFNLVHRPIMNRLQRKLGTHKGIDWCYLGPSIRGPQESWYDTLFWSICAFEVNEHMSLGVPHRRYRVRMPCLPFVLATLFEASVSTVCLFAFYQTTTP